MATSSKKALCVGINVFKNFPDATLQGCVNDAHDMSALLQEKFGYKPDEITVLTDDQATKAAIMQQLTQMVNDAKAGKLKSIVFSLSSHGTQVPDTNGDEKDKADEAFCPHDLAQKGNQWDPEHIIVDDELNALFGQLPPSATLEAFFDTCHSGTGFKDLWPIRYLPPPAPIGEGDDEGEDLPVRGVEVSLSKAKPSQRILWAGCRADQTSADANFDGRANGAFTFNYIKAVRATKSPWTREQIIAKMRDAMKNEFTQIPQLEADALNRTRELE